MNTTSIDLKVFQINIKTFEGYTYYKLEINIIGCPSLCFSNDLREILKGYMIDSYYFFNKRYRQVIADRNIFISGLKKDYYPTLLEYVKRVLSNKKSYICNNLV